MAKIIAILNGKGGVGKTTSTINIATAIQRKGFSVAVVDTDPQGSISNWFDEEKCAFDLTEAASEKEVYQVRKSLKSYDYVIIDGAAAISAISSAAVMVSDLVVIPVTPSPLDLEARFLITKKIPHSKMLAVLKDSIEDTGVPAFRTSISQRQAYVKVMLDGSTVFDTDDGAAKGEIDVLTNEILEITA